MQATVFANAVFANAERVTQIATVRDFSIEYSHDRVFATFLLVADWLNGCRAPGESMCVFVGDVCMCVG